MKASPPSIVLILASWVLGLSAFVCSQPPSSAHFRMATSVLDGGGMPVISDNHIGNISYAQPSSVGKFQSSNFRLYTGYLTPKFAVSPLSSLHKLVIHVQTSDILLNWEHCTGATTYRVYRSTDPLFIPDPTTFLATVVDTAYTDIHATLLPATRYYYNVTACRGFILSPVGISPADITEATNKHDIHNMAH
jgi:hypothetical protein